MAKNPLSMAIVVLGVSGHGPFCKKVRDELRKLYPKHAFIFVEASREMLANPGIVYAYKFVQDGVRIVVVRDMHERYDLPEFRRAFNPHPVRLISCSEGSEGEVVFKTYSLREKESEMAA